MCVIVDANVAGEVFGEGGSPAGQQFFDWLNSGRGQLVVGGRLLEELEGSRNFTAWAKEATLAGRIRSLSKEETEARIRQLEHSARHVSDDPHVLAVAQLGGARLLFTNDESLEQDFKNKLLIDRPRGRVYHTRDIQTPNDNKAVSRTHRRLLSTTGLCRGGS